MDSTQLTRVLAVRRTEESQCGPRIAFQPTSSSPENILEFAVRVSAWMLRSPWGRGLGAHEGIRVHCSQSISPMKGYLYRPRICNHNLLSSSCSWRKRHSSTKQPDSIDKSLRGTSQTPGRDKYLIHILFLLSFFFSILFKLLCISVYAEIWVDRHEFLKSPHPAREMWKKQSSRYEYPLSKPQPWDTNHLCRKTHQEMLLTMLTYFTDEYNCILKRFSQ